MLKETIIHEAYKDGKYTDEPSSLFLYIEEKKKYANVLGPIHKLLFCVHYIGGSCFKPCKFLTEYFYVRHD